MAITSTPGPDGIMTSIYKCYANQLIYPIKKYGKLPWKVENYQKLLLK